MNLLRIILGNPIATENADEERLPKKIALAVFSSDALSSTAYATEEILLVLAVAVAFGQTTSFNYVVPISVAIVILLGIVAASYRQTIFAYPSGGGAYIVSKDNLGTLPSLVAGAALLVDYVLTVSVSIAAGVAAITSAAQGTSFEWLKEYVVVLCLSFVLIITIANLRGLKESGFLFAFPTYAFVISFLLMIVYGLFHYYTIGGVAAIPIGEEPKQAEGYEAQALTLFLLLGAFSNGCTALTGVEAISNGVPAFKKPESNNAATTLTVMAVLLGTMFIGTSVLAYLYQVHPHVGETVISQFARIIFTGNFGWFYYVIQAATAAILILAANTSYADFPRLASLIAHDGFLPRQFTNKGDRLVFTYGIIFLTIFASILLIAFEGDTSRLIPLYAVGVFLSFTLSQSGMVIHWLRERRRQRGEEIESLSAIHSTNAEKQVLPDLSAAVAEDEKQAAQAKQEKAPKPDNWLVPLTINAVGAVATFTVLMVFIVTKFVHGAWLIVLVIPLLVFMFRAIHSHYVSVAKQLATDMPEELRLIKHEVIVPVSGIHRGVIRALEYAKSIAPEHVRAVYVEIDEKSALKLKEQWEQWNFGVELVILKSPFRSLTRPLLKYIDRVDRQRGDDVVTIVLPEFIPAKWWHQLLHNQNSLILKGVLLFKRNVIVINVPYHLEE
ncbi:MAG: APC family permease [Pyrinomonadaceae bacterium]|nr:APC family permease [Pyrinomonadaceae bacterium]